VLVIGQGRLEWENGDFYQGAFECGFRQGVGEMVERSGRRYAGEFVKSLKQGGGKEDWPNGDSYEGEYMNDEFQGKGTLITTASVFTGSFFEGLDSSSMK